MSQGERQRRSSSQSQPSAIFASLTRKPRPQQDAKDAQETQQAAFKTSRRYVLDQVRNDWFYEPCCPGLSTPSLRPDLHLDVTSWATREQEDTSGSEAEREKEQSRKAEGAAAGTSPYRFEDPDDIEHALLQRKRKRRKVLEDEMQWNDGLRNWVARRDAWTGAKPPPSAPHSNPTELPAPSVTTEETAAPTGGGDDGNHDVQMPDAEPEEMSRLESGVSNDSSLAVQSEPCQDVDTSMVQPPAEFEETLIPVLEPDRLYGDNARPSIKPSTYPAIYSRLIVQSNSPAVPINLKHVTQALVHGWKQNGEWPPKPTPRVDVPAHRRQRGGNVRTITSPVGQAEAGAEADANEKAKRRSGSFGGAVKKVFNLTSGRRLHLRSNSRDNEDPPKESTALPS